MKHEWLIDVLADLKAFADAKGLAASAAALEDASLVVMAELSSGSRVRTGGSNVLGEHDGQNGSVTYLFAKRSHA